MASIITKRQIRHEYGIEAATLTIRLPGTINSHDQYLRYLYVHGHQCAIHAVLLVHAVGQCIHSAPFTDIYNA